MTIHGGFLAYCRAYPAMAQEAEIRRIVLQDARSVLTGTDQGQQHQQCDCFIAGFAAAHRRGVIVECQCSGAGKGCSTAA